MINTTNSKNVFAKTAAAIAVLGLIAFSFVAFAPQAGAQTAVPRYTFTRDLYLGWGGAVVLALQTGLRARGSATPAGPTTYFGAQTRAAVAAYQAANGIQPTAGYFGPITRAHVNQDAVVVVPTPTPDDDDDNDNDSLSGGEADLNDFELVREESSGNEGEEEVEVFTAEFDVDDGDVRIERMEITASSTDDDLDQDPWDYFDRIVLFDADGDELTDMDVDDRDEWDEAADEQYVLTITGLDYVVDEGDMAAITAAFDIAGSIDTADQSQEFAFWIEDRGIRAVDAEGIQQYIGNDNETVTFGFDEEQTGDLNISSSDEDPNASILVGDEDDESDEYTVFVFDIENEEDADALITDLVIDATTGSGDADDVIRSATLMADGDEFDGDINGSTIDFDDIDVEIAGDDEMTFELMVTLVRDPANTTISFEIDETDVEAEGLDSGDDSDVSGSAESETHTIALTGIAVEGVSTSQTVVTPGDSAANTYGTYTIRFDVEAIDEDAYIATTSADSGTVGVTYDINGSTFTAENETSFLSSTADSVNGFYVVDEGDTETFTLTVTLNPADAGTFSVELDTIRFNDAASFSGSTVFSVDSGNPDFETDPMYIAD